MFKLEGLHSIDPHTTYIDGAAVSQQSHIYNRPWWVSNDGVGLACCRSIAPVDWLSRNNLQQHRGRYYGGVICSSQLYRAPINSYPWRERGIIHAQSSLDIPHLVDQMALNFRISSHRDTQVFLTLLQLPVSLLSHGKDHWHWWFQTHQSDQQRTAPHCNQGNLWEKWSNNSGTLSREQIFAIQLKIFRGNFCAQPRNFIENIRLQIVLTNYEKLFHKRLLEGMQHLFSEGSEQFDIFRVF